MTKQLSSYCQKERLPIRRLPFSQRVCLKQTVTVNNINSGLTHNPAQLTNKQHTQTDADSFEAQTCDGRVQRKCFSFIFLVPKLCFVTSLTLSEKVVCCLFFSEACLHAENGCGKPKLEQRNLAVIYQTEDKG